MKSYDVSFYPTDERGNWLQSEGAARVDVLAEGEVDAKLQAIERLATGSDGERERVIITIDRDFQRITLESKDEVRHAVISVSENKNLIVSNLFIEEA
jgi:hypothetical protein